MFYPELRDVLGYRGLHVFAPDPGELGRAGAARCDPGAVDETTLASALVAARLLAAPKMGRLSSGQSLRSAAR